MGKSRIVCALLVAIVLGFLVFSGSVFAASVTLGWSPSGEADLAGYKLYYGTASRSYTASVNVGNRTSYTLPGLLDGRVYYFAATAYNASGIESEYSNEATCSTPTGCAYSISPTTQSFGASGGTASVAVSTQSGCSWSAASGISWITIVSGGSGTGNGTVGYTVSPNSTTSTRTAAVTIAGQILTVNEAAAAGTSTGSFTITASAGQGGSISPSGSITVASGGSRTFTIKPNNQRYAILNLVVDGVSIGPFSTYTFGNVTANHSIQATFVRNK